MTGVNTNIFNRCTINHCLVSPFKVNGFVIAATSALTVPTPNELYAWAL